MKKVSLKYKTIIISDIHLGTPDCQIDKINYFLKHSHSETLILNGDIIDGWSLKRQGGWTKKHTRFIRLILKKLEKKNTKVIYLRGNHDDILSSFLPLNFDNLKIIEEYIHHTIRGSSYWVIHGDIFDAVTQNSKFLAILGDIGYQSLLKLNRYYNRYRSWRGKEFFSLSKTIKAKVKQAVSYISKFEEQAALYAQKKGCSGFICGHIHTPEDKIINGVHYMNSGDWVESNTAIIEDFEGNLRIIEFSEFCKEIEEIMRENRYHEHKKSISFSVDEDINTERGKYHHSHIQS